MTVQGSDNFADAPVLPVGATSLPTPNGSLTEEVGEPGESWDARSAWWKLQPTTTTYVDISAWGGSGGYWKTLDLYSGTSLTSLVRRAGGADTAVTLLTQPLVAGETYWIRVATESIAPAFDYTLRVLDSGVGMTPVAAETPTIRAVTMAPSGELIAGVTQLSPTEEIWFGLRYGDQLIELDRVNVDGLVPGAVTTGSNPPHRVAWIRFISDDVLSFSVKYGNSGENVGTLIFFARYDGTRLVYQAYNLYPVVLAAVDYSRDIHLSGQSASIAGRRYANGAWSMHIITFTLSGTQVSNIAVGPVVTGGRAAIDLALEEVKFLDNGDCLFSYNDRYRHVVTPQGVSSTHWRKEGPLLGVSSSIANMWYPGMTNPLANGRLWVLATHYVNHLGVGPGMVIYSVDPYTGTWAGPYSIGVTLVGWPPGHAEVAPGLWLAAWNVGNVPYALWMVLIDVRGATPQMVSQTLVSSGRRVFLDAEVDAGDQGLAIRGENPTGLIHFHRSEGGTFIPGDNFNYAWYPTYVAPPNEGALVTSRRAFIG